MVIDEKINTLLENINEINIYKKELERKQGLHDQQISDILHYIDSKDKLNPAKDFYLLKELKRIGNERALVKKLLRNIQRFKNVVNKEDNVEKYNKLISIGEGKYNPRIYKDMKNLEIKDNFLDLLK